MLSFYRFWYYFEPIQQNYCSRDSETLSYSKRSYQGKCSTTSFT